MPTKGEPEGMLPGVGGAGVLAARIRSRCILYHEISLKKKKTRNTIGDADDLGIGFRPRRANRDGEITLTPTHTLPKPGLYSTVAECVFSSEGPCSPREVSVFPAWLLRISEAENKCRKAVD